MLQAKQRSLVSIWFPCEVLRFRPFTYLIQKKETRTPWYTVSQRLLTTAEHHLESSWNRFRNDFHSWEYQTYLLFFSEPNPHRLCCAKKNKPTKPPKTNKQNHRHPPLPTHQLAPESKRRNLAKPGLDGCLGGIFVQEHLQLPHGDSQIVLGEPQKAKAGKEGGSCWSRGVDFASLNNNTRYEETENDVFGPNQLDRRN